RSFRLRFHADDDAGERAWLRGVGLGQSQLDALAAGLVDELAKGWIVGQVEGESFQRALDRFLAVVADGADLAVARILQDKALEQIVDVGGGEGEVDARVAFDLAFALKVADAAAEEDDLGQRQGRRRGPNRTAVFAGRRLGRRGTGRPEDGDRGGHD